MKGNFLFTPLATCGFREVYSLLPRSADGAFFDYHIKCKKDVSLSQIPLHYPVINLAYMFNYHSKYFLNDFNNLLYTSPY